MEPIKEKVLVLMSTYNGELFLPQQIDSIIKQKNVDVEIIVRDDGSTDKTIDILEDYQRQGLLSYCLLNTQAPICWYDHTERYVARSIPSNNAAAAFSVRALCHKGFDLIRLFDDIL